MIKLKAYWPKNQEVFDKHSWQMIYIPNDENIHDKELYKCTVCDLRVYSVLYNGIKCYYTVLQEMPTCNEQLMKNVLE